MAPAREAGDRARRRRGGAVEERGLAAGKSTAAACNGWIVFEDEAGQSMGSVKISVTGSRSVTWSGQEYSFTEEREPGSPIHLSLQHLDSVDVAFDRTGTPGQRKTRGDSLVITPETVGEGVQSG